MPKVTYDPERLKRELSDRSAILTRAAHALELAAEQLREAPSSSSSIKNAVDVRVAAMTAMLGALGALEVSGQYELAAFMESIIVESD